MSRGCPWVNLKWLIQEFLVGIFPERMREKFKLVAPMLDLQFGHASDFGKVRTNNEDAIGSFVPASSQQTRSHGYLFAVADGVGGMNSGEIASATAVSVVTNEFPKAKPGAMLISLLPHLIQQANVAVHDCNLAHEHQPKMATTLVACSLRFDMAIVSHVGDSRCYLVRNSQARQLTQDHTLVNERLKMGLLSPADIANSDSRRVLLRSIGTEMFVSPDTSALTILPGDVLVLCTDGLHDKMSEDEIAAIASQNKDPKQIAHELVARAVEIDGADNTSALVIRVRSVEQIGMYRARPYRLPW
jgi:PPM family protein phosphatase